jgi:hypothetical protein
VRDSVAVAKYKSAESALCWIGPRADHGDTERAYVPVHPGAHVLNIEEQGGCRSVELTITPGVLFDLEAAKEGRGSTWPSEQTVQCNRPRICTHACPTRRVLLK